MKTKSILIVISIIITVCVLSLLYLAQVRSDTDNHTPQPTTPTAPSDQLIIAPETEPDDINDAEQVVYLEKTIEEAEVIAQERGEIFRVIFLDNEPQIVTQDFVPGRINAYISNGVVEDFEIEGEATEDET